MQGRIMVLWLLVALCFPSAARFSTPQDGPSPLEAMKKLDQWVGDWKGSGWVVGRDGKRIEFTLAEKVERKVGGTVLLLDGKGTTKNNKGDEVVIHDGLTLVSYDTKTGKYRWIGHEISREAIDTELMLIDGGVQWSITAREPGATVRFTVMLDGRNWREVGEASADGKTWNTFMESKLERQK